MLAFMLLFMPAFYPGVNVYVSPLLTLLLVLPTSLVFALFAAAMSRSGTAGLEFTLWSLLHWMLAHGMVVVGLP